MVEEGHADGVFAEVPEIECESVLEGEENAFEDDLFL